MLHDCDVEQNVVFLNESSKVISETYVTLNIYILYIVFWGDSESAGKSRFGPNMFKAYPAQILMHYGHRSFCLSLTPPKKKSNPKGSCFKTQYFWHQTSCGQTGKLGFSNVSQSQNASWQVNQP